MTDLNGTASNRQFTDAQKAEFETGLELLLRRMVMAAPQIAPHLNSGGVITFSTMSGLTLRLGFGAQQGGLLLPNGIKPVNLGKGFGK